MEETNNKEDLKSILRETLSEILTSERTKQEPVLKTELVEERRRRETLEQQVRELVEDAQRSRRRAEEAELQSMVRTELQKNGVNKIDLAFRAVREDVARTEDGRIVGKWNGTELSLPDYIRRFTDDNPELMPARIPGGAGATIGQAAKAAATVELDRIRPGMSTDELDRARMEIARLAALELGQRQDD